jgi:hypothetical protein
MRANSINQKEKEHLNHEFGDIQLTFPIYWSFFLFSITFFLASLLFLQ